MATVDLDLDSTYELFVGEARTLTFTIRNEGGSIVPVTGWTAEFQVRLTRYTPDPPLIEVAATILNPPGTDGQLRVALEAASYPTGFKAGGYFFGIARTNPFDVVKEGRIVFRKAAVHP